MRMDRFRPAHRLSSVLAAVLAALAGALLLAGAARAETYTVQPGDTLWDIAALFGTEISVLLALNDELDSPHELVVGQQIRIPDNVAPQANGQPAPSIYTVRTGDTLSEIADRFGLSIETLRALNPGIEPHMLYIGAELVLSGAPRAAPPAVTAGASPPPQEPPPSDYRGIDYVVAAGDSASAIADAHGVSLAEIQAANGSDLALIQVGQVLRIPMPDALVSAIDPQAGGAQITASYTIAAGDNASAIAELHGISLDELQRLNPSLDLNRIYVGHTLTVPYIGEVVRAPGTAPAIAARHRTHIVAAGDSFSAIAEQHGVSLSELRALNPSRASDLIVIGEQIRLPGTVAAPSVAEDRTVANADLLQYAAAELGALPHTLLANNSWLLPDQWVAAGTVLRVPHREGLLITVQPGDTLLDIAQRHGVAMEAILADPAHGVDNPNEIVIGQEIILPISRPDFQWPAAGVITDGFGLCRNWDCSYRHRGLDMGIDMWEPITAAADGLVTFVGGEACCGLGLYVEVEHPDGWKTVYGHLAEFAVWQGQLVQQGELLGYNGNTGISTGPHLHFEVHHRDWYIDPLVVLP